jgi:hypothetical protein
VTKETAEKSHNRCHRASWLRMQWRSERVSGCNMKVEGSRPPVLKSFPKHRRKIPVALKNSAEISGTNGINFFCYMYKSSLRHPVWVPEINVTACNSAYPFLWGAKCAKIAKIFCLEMALLCFICLVSRCKISYGWRSWGFLFTPTDGSAFTPTGFGASGYWARDGLGDFYQTD